MASKAVRYSQFEDYNPPKVSGRYAWKQRIARKHPYWILFKVFVKLITSSCVRTLRTIVRLMPKEKKLLKKRFLFITGILLFALQPSPKAHAAILDPMVSKTPEIVRVEPLRAVKIKEQSSLAELPDKIASVPAIPTSGTSNLNLYSAGSCTWHVKNLKSSLPNNLGNADTWYSRATAQGMATGLTPRVGAAAQVKGAMHVVYVLAVYGNGTILISEMNYDYVLYHQRTNTVPASNYEYIY